MWAPRDAYTDTKVLYMNSYIYIRMYTYVNIYIWCGCSTHSLSHSYSLSPCMMYIYFRHFPLFWQIRAYTQRDSYRYKRAVHGCGYGTAGRSIRKPACRLWHLDINGSFFRALHWHHGSSLNCPVLSAFFSLPLFLSLFFCPSYSYFLFLSLSLSFFLSLSLSICIYMYIYIYMHVCI